MCGRVGGDQAAAALVVGIERMPCNQVLNVIEGGLRVLENALLTIGCMGCERAGDDEFLPASYHPTAARAGTDPEPSRIEYNHIATGMRELDGRRQPAVAAADDHDVGVPRERDLGRRLGRRGFPPVGSGLESSGKAIRHRRLCPANFAQSEVLRSGPSLGLSIIMATLDAN